MCVCVCVCVRTLYVYTHCVCVCVREREREPKVGYSGRRTTVVTHVTFELYSTLISH